MNFTREPLEKSGIRFALLNDVYINFVHLDETPGFARRFNQYDGKFNEVRFKGPLTTDELQQLQREESLEKINDFIERGKRAYP